jgi:hypothetical protein
VSTSGDRFPDAAVCTDGKAFRFADVIHSTIASGMSRRDKDAARVAGAVAGTVDGRHRR